MSRQFFNQWESKPKLNAPRRDFSRALFGLQVIVTALSLQHFKSDLKKIRDLVTNINFSKEAYLINNKHSDFLFLVLLTFFKFYFFN